MNPEFLLLRSVSGTVVVTDTQSGNPVPPTNPGEWKIPVPFGGGAFRSVMVTLGKKSGPTADKQGRCDVHLQPHPDPLGRKNRAMIVSTRTNDITGTPPPATNGNPRIRTARVFSRPWQRALGAEAANPIGKRAVKGKKGPSGTLDEVVYCRGSLELVFRSA